MKKSELKGNLYKNLTVTLTVQLVRMLLQFALQKVFIDTLGVAYLGYNSVFKNILQMLNMADFGIGIAITGFLFKPLAAEDEERVSALMYLYRRIYHLIGFAIAGIGIIIMIILPVIIPDALCSNSYLRILFVINLFGTLSTYFLAYRRTLLIADQKSYYTGIIDMVFDLTGTILQIITLFILSDYIVYLVINVGKNILANILIAYESNKKFGRYLKEPHSEIVNEYKKPVKKYIGNVFITKIGGYVFSGTDNIIISVCKGSVLAGYLSNYTLVSVGLKAIITQMLSAVQATYGKYIVTEDDKEKQCRMTDNYIFVDYLIGNMCMVCCIVLFQPFVKIFYGTEYLLSFSTAVLIAVNLGLAILLIIPSQVFVVFKLHSYDKYVVCSSAILNIVVSVALVIHMGINGVLIGTTITSLIYLFSRLYIIAVKVFHVTFAHYIFKLIKYSFVSGITLAVSYFTGKGFAVNGWKDLITYAVMTGGISIVISIIFTMNMRESVFFIKNIFPFGEKIFWCLVLGIVLLVAAAFISLENDHAKEDGHFAEHVPCLEAERAVVLPDVDDADSNTGFTCTGMTYDEDRDVYYIGKYGKTYQEESYDGSVIVVMDRELKEILNVIQLKDAVNYENDNIQGVAYDSNDQSIWFTDGKRIYEIDAGSWKWKRTISLPERYRKPNGLAYEKDSDTLWCLLQEDFLLHLNKDGNIIEEIACDYDAQDQLGFDEEGILCFTAGADYKGTDNFIYELINDGIFLRYRLLDSYAVEGLVFREGYLMVANDGLYHEAKVPANLINFYKLDDL